MTVFELLLFISGCASVFGIIYFEFQIYYSSAMLTKIGTTFAMFVFLTVFLSGQSAVFRMVTVLLEVCLLFVGLRLHIRYLEKNMLQQVHLYVKNIILQMKLGVGFRQAMELSMQYETSHFMQIWLKKIYENVVFTQHKSAHFKSQMLLKLISELRAAEKDPYTALNRLENLYSWLKIQSDFRRKSGKILAQLRVQSFFILVIYIALIVFVSRFIGMEEVVRVLPLSIVLMVSGVVCVFYFGRKMKWNL